MNNSRLLLFPASKEYQQYLQTLSSNQLMLEIDDIRERIVNRLPSVDLFSILSLAEALIKEIEKRIPQQFSAQQNLIEEMKENLAKLIN